MKKTTLKIKVTLTQPLLGSLPGNKELLEDHVADKAPNQAALEEETASVPEMMEKGTTVFPRDEKGLFIYDYQMKGFLKEAISVLVELGEITGLTKWTVKRAVDCCVFVTPRRMHFKDKDGKFIKECKEFCERPLRATTLQGDRVAIARSEMLPEGISFEAEITLLESSNSKSKFSSLNRDSLVQALDYGQMKGLGQWRNGGYGSIKCEEIK